MTKTRAFFKKHFLTRPFDFNMGKISFEMIAKSPSHTKKRRDETVQQYVRRLTHLYFSEKNIDEIVSVYDLNWCACYNCNSWNLFITANNFFFLTLQDNLYHCRNLSVLYLYDNNISRIKNLGFASNLTHLYLQKNEITKIEGLDKLRRLTKL